MTTRPIIIKDTHRGLWYEDGVLKKVLEAGRYKLPFLQGRLGRPLVEIQLVDVRERELTIKGQEILTADKVAIRVSIIVQFRVTDPRAAIHEVEKYEERLYSDVQLAARRSLASMTLDEILTNRNRLSEDILRDVKETAARYGVSILRADVKDLVFPGNLQEIMNKVLAAERTAQAQLVEARTRAQTQQIAAEAQAEISRIEAEALARTSRLQSEAEAAARKIRNEGELAALRDSEQSAKAYAAHPALLRLRELETLKELSGSANVKIYVGFDRPGNADEKD
jgi:regulator of protease activity HflC (stomatin/prohibitin superfamily)